MKYKVGLSDSKSQNKSKSRMPAHRASHRTVNVASPMLTQESPLRRMRKFNTLASSKHVNPKVQSKKRSIKKTIAKIIGVFAGLGFFVALAGAISVGMYLKKIERSLPDPTKLIDRSSDQGTILYDRNGRELYTIIGDQNREFVKIGDLPETTKWSVLAAEDIEFYQHKGLDYPGIARAIYANTTSGEKERGASTISQQLVRNTLLYDILGDEVYEKSYSRKIKEVLITMQIEQKMSKDEILQMYLNEVWCGGVNYGIQACAKAYYGKDVKDLTLAESAMIAGTFPNPSLFSPIFGANPEAGVQRQTFVLDQMLKHKDLTGVTKEQIEAAKSEQLVYKQQKVDITAPHFVFYVKEQLINEFGADRVLRGGLKVTTTLDMSLQDIAQEEVIYGVENYGHQWGVMNGAMVVLNPKTGEILAMVGSVDYWNTEDPRIDGNVNVTTAPRQQGSSVKPYTYLAAFEKGYGPWLETPDVSGLNFGGYRLFNWDNSNSGPMVARQALIQSRNIPAVYTAQLVGTAAFVDVAQRAGITTLDASSGDNHGLSITLGSADMKLLEHAAGYATFATGGIKHPTTGILKVVDYKGDVLKEFKADEGQRVFDEKDIYMLNWILCDMGNFADQPLKENYYINGRRVMCGKTGTTSGPTDLVSFMYNQNIVLATWTGNNNNIETPGAWSTTVPLPINHNFIERVYDRFPSEPFTRPAGILATTVCNDTGHTPGAGVDCAKVPSIYKEGYAPSVDNRKKFDVCKDSGKQSTNVEASKKYDLLESKSIMVGFKLENELQQGPYTSYLKGKNYIFDEPEKADCKLPLGPDNAPIIEITSPGSGASFHQGDSININANVRVLESVTKVEFMFDGALITGGVDTSEPYGVTYVIPSNISAGSHTVSAKVTDNKGKTATATVTISVIVDTPTVTINITSPASGSTVTLPTAISAGVLGSVNAVDRVDFEISGPGGYAQTLSDNILFDGWSVTWNPAAEILPGTYTIVAKAYKNGTLKGQSSAITVTIN